LAAAVEEEDQDEQREEGAGEQVPDHGRGGQRAAGDAVLIGLDGFDQRVARAADLLLAQVRRAVDQPVLALLDAGGDLVGKLRHTGHELLDDEGHGARDQAERTDQRHHHADRARHPDPLHPVHQRHQQRRRQQRDRHRDQHRGQPGHQHRHRDHRGQDHQQPPRPLRGLPHDRMHRLGIRSGPLWPAGGAFLGVAHAREPIRRSAPRTCAHDRNARLVGVSAPLEAVKQTMHTRWPLYLTSMLLANAFGAVLMWAFLQYGLPVPEGEAADARRIGLFVPGLVFVTGGLLSLAGSALMLRPVMRWQMRGGPPSRQEQMAALHAPLRQAILHLVLWLLGGAVLAGLIISESPKLAGAVIVTLCMAATIVFGFTYMLGERILRPVAAQALTEGTFDHTLTPGVGTRMAMTWGMGTFAPTFAIVLLCVTQISSDVKFSAQSLAISILLLCGVIILQALALSMLTASSISDPVRQLSQAIARAQEGTREVQVEVYDGSEIGMLQV